MVVVDRVKGSRPQHILLSLNDDPVVALELNYSPFKVVDEFGSHWIDLQAEGRLLNRNDPTHAWAITMFFLPTGSGSTVHIPVEDLVYFPELMPEYAWLNFEEDPELVTIKDISKSEYETMAAFGSVPLLMVSIDEDGFHEVQWPRRGLRSPEQVEAINRQRREWMSVLRDYSK